MTLQTDQNNNLYCNIVPVTIINTTINRLYLTINDNLINTAMLIYRLSIEDLLFLTSSMQFTGNDYINWSGDNETIFNYVANQLNLTLI